MLFLLATAVAVKAGDYTYITNSDNTITITRYTGPGGDVVIPSTIEGKTVTIIWDRAFAGHALSPNINLTSVAIPDSVTSIGNDAFSFCIQLTSVRIGTGVINIGEEAFFYTSLTSVTIPDSVTSIGDEAFYGCYGLTNVMIGKSVTGIGIMAFASCNILTNITVDAGNSTYSSVNGVLFNKNQTALVVYPNGKVGSYTVPDSVTSIEDRAFYVCINLTSVTIPASVIHIGDGAFSLCVSLTSVTIPDSVTSIGEATFWHTSLTSMVIPDSVIRIGDEAFHFIESLISVTIGKSVTRIGNNAFGYCEKLIGVYFLGNAPSIGEDVFWIDDLATIYYLPGTTGWGWTFGGRPAMPWWDGPQISANGAREDVFLNRGDPVKITVAAVANDLAARPLDWWIIAWANDKLFYLNNSKQWIQFDGSFSNCRPVYQGSLFNLPSTEVLNTADLSSGSYTFWFAVDYPMDGILNLGGYILIDSVNVTVQ